MALLPLTLSSLLLASCTKTERIAQAVTPPAERIQCVAAGDRPAVPAEYVIDWSKVATVDQARAEHMKFVASVRSREGVVTGYILRIEGRLFACSNNAAWLRDFFSQLPGAR
jgi:hypothetical protein